MEIRSANSPMDEGIGDLNATPLGTPVTPPLATKAGGFKVNTSKPLAPYIPALGPILRLLLWFIFACTAILGASGLYLISIRGLNFVLAPTSYENTFTFWMFLVHAGVGILSLSPFFIFGFWHLTTAYTRPNRRAVRLGIALFVSGAVVCLTGIALFQIEGMPQLQTGTRSRQLVYWLHVILPLAAIFFYVRHRQAGPKIHWKVGYIWGGITAIFIVGMGTFHMLDPRQWFAEGSPDGIDYFFPSDSRTRDGNFIPKETLMMDEYCMKCHQDIYNDHLHSAHKFSSFNNPAYLFSVRETREFSLKRDGNVRGARWCAGCHDPVPFFSGQFDNPKYDDVNDITAHAGITCTACHAITNVNNTLGNAAYTIENPEHYPFAFSENSMLQWVNNQLIKGKPEFHKKTFLKPFHKTAEFCSTCHKVSLPPSLNHYKDFLRGQNHYDSYLLSGVSGHGLRSFYYPPKAETNCASCHMPTKESNDFAAKDLDGSGVRKIHDHFFPAANTGLFELLKKEPRYQAHKEDFDQAIQKETDFLKGVTPEGIKPLVRVDIFGVKKNASTNADQLIAPLRPNLPVLEPGKKYLIEVVVRTLRIGHPFSQGTVDSNEIWVDFEAISNGKTIARNGAIANPDETGPVDEWAHFINVHMLDRNGHRINRRNPQDIFVPFYDHQIPPGAANVLHYRLDIPKDISGPIELRARLRYRKFDYEYMSLVHKDQKVPKLPIVDMAEDKVILPVLGHEKEVAKQESKIQPAWQRWNDYGIANFIEGGLGNKRGHRIQAAQAFRKLLELKIPEAEGLAHLNLARVLLEDSNWNEAGKELQLAKQSNPPAPWWSTGLFTAEVNTANARTRHDYEQVIADLERLLDSAYQPQERGFDFTKDYVVIDILANRIFQRSELEERGSPAERQWLLRTIQTAQRTLALDAEDLEAHDLLGRAYGRLMSDLTAAQTIPELNLANLTQLAKSLRTGSKNRLEIARELLAGIDNLSSIPLTGTTPKLIIIRELFSILNPLFQAEKDVEFQNHLAVLLAHLHRIAHSIYKPDELARSETTRLYRLDHPAANYAAQDRVIYPTTSAQREAILKFHYLPAD